MLQKLRILQCDLIRNLLSLTRNIMNIKAFIIILIISSQSLLSMNFTFKKVASIDPNHQEQSINGIAISPAINNSSIILAIHDDGRNHLPSYIMNHSSEKLTRSGNSIYDRNLVDVAFTPMMGDQQHAISVNTHGSAKVYRVHDQGRLENTHEFNTDSESHTIAISSSLKGHTLTAIAGLTCAKIYSTKDNQTFQQIAEKTTISNWPFFDIAFSPALPNNRCFFATINSLPNSPFTGITIDEVDEYNRLALKKYVTTNRVFKSIAFMPLVNGRLFAATSDDNSQGIIIYSVDQETGVLTHTGQQFNIQNPGTIRFSPEVINGQFFATIISDGKALIYSVKPPIDTDDLFGDIKHAAS